MANNSALIPADVPITFIINDLSAQVAAIRHKTDTLINYYIYPNPTPSEIAAYDPRLAILDSRLASLATLSYPNLACLIDNSDALVAGYLEQITDQLLNAVHGIRALFENYYDRTLEQRKPYEFIYQILELRERQLQSIKGLDVTHADELMPNQFGDFCRGAIQMLNGHDRGRINAVADRDLLAQHRARLRQYAGAYLWWECSECDFRLRYHLTDSGKTNIVSTEEVRRHDGTPVDYKAVFLVKCHLAQPVGTRQGSGVLRPLSLSQSDIVYPKYGCEFCYATGEKLVPGVTAFDNGRDLITHMGAEHSRILPPAPLLQKMNVAVKGKCAEGVYAWDINFR
ncbi:hypothetical protein DV738_g2113, partial [Chaetothyriales sp. CBS 135597]